MTWVPVPSSAMHPSPLKCPMLGNYIWEKLSHFLKSMEQTAGNVVLRKGRPAPSRKRPVCLTLLSMTGRGRGRGLWPPCPSAGPTQHTGAALPGPVEMGGHIPLPADITPNPRKIKLHLFHGINWGWGDKEENVSKRPRVGGAFDGLPTPRKCQGWILVKTRMRVPGVWADSAKSGAGRWAPSRTVCVTPEPAGGWQEVPVSVLGAQ